MTRLAFPSNLFPEFPKISLEIQSGWEGRNFPDSLIGLIKSKEERFSPNIIINVKKVSENYSFELYSKEVTDYLSHFLKVVELENSLCEINRTIWMVREYTFIDKSLGALAQISACALLPIEGGQFLVSFTGTTDIHRESDRIEFQELQEILRSIDIQWRF